MKPKLSWPLILTAALVMLATLPGRTQGLGLITEPLLADMRIDSVRYATLNLWATLIGSLFCFPAGFIFDRFGLGRPTAFILLSLALVVAALSQAPASALILFALITLTRGFGQSALSIASLTAMGKGERAQAGWPMAVFSVFVNLFFAVAFGLIGLSIRQSGWRVAWLQVAAFLAFVVAPLAFLYFRKIIAEKPSAAITLTPAPTPAPESGFTAQAAIKTPAFWLFAGAAALFNLVSSGLGLFNEAVLAERGFAQKDFHIFLALTALLSLGGQFWAGWLSRQWDYRSLTALSLFLYAASLTLIPLVGTRPQLFALGGLLGMAGGMIIVVFFSVWPDVFGLAQLGRIQARAQFLTVLSSALGPVLFAQAHARLHSYAPILFAISLIVVAVGLLALRVPMPLQKGESPSAATMN